MENLETIKSKRTTGSAFFTFGGKDFGKIDHTFTTNCTGYLGEAFRTIPDLEYCADKNCLPLDCIFDKGRAGCGGTTIALTNEEDYVVAAPLQELVRNKAHNNENCLAVLAGVTENDVRDYIEDRRSNSLPVKIMITYDSLYKIPVDFRSSLNILIDEYHTMLMAYDYRDKAMQGVLDTFREYKSFCFMSATPIDREDIFEELQGIEIVTLDWANAEKIPVKVVKYSGLGSLTPEITKYLSGYIDENGNERHLHIFINSIDTINKIYQLMPDMSKNNSKVVYSRNRSKQDEVMTSDGEAIINSSTFAESKRVNFYTSCCFEGCDIMDEFGDMAVISYSNAGSHTLLDIDHTVIQVHGRIRNTDNKQITHYINGTRHDIQEFDEYLKGLEYSKKMSIMFAELYNNESKENRNCMKANNAFNIKYLAENPENELYFDEKRMTTERFKIKALTKYNYSTSVADAYNKNNDYELVEATKMKKNRGRKVENQTFGHKLMTLITYFQDKNLIDENDKVNQVALSGLLNNYEDRITKIISSIEGLDYCLRYFTITTIKSFEKPIEVKRAVIINKEKNFHNAVRKLLNDNYDIHIGYTIAASKAKEIIDEIIIALSDKHQNTIDSLDNIKFTNYYEVKPTTRRDGQNIIKAYKIVAEKMINN